MFDSLDWLIFDDPPVVEDQFHGEHISAVIDIAGFGNWGAEGGSTSQPRSCEGFSHDADEVFSVGGDRGLRSQVREGLGDQLGEVL